MSKTQLHYDELADWVDPKTAWTYLRISRSLMYELIRRGELPARRFGRTIRIPKSALRPEEVAR